LRGYPLERAEARPPRNRSLVNTLKIIALRIPTLGLIWGLVGFGLFAPEPALGVRVKDAGRIVGADDLRVIGYGLVVGLESTGDSPKSLFTNQSLANMLERFGIAVDGENVRAKNVASVMVSAEIPTFSRDGSRFDVLVSSLGDAKSLQGGILLQTTLTDIDGNYWAIAGGPVSIGGFNVEAGNVSVRQNYSVVGRVPAGGMLKLDLPVGLPDTTRLTYMLRNGDFTTARRMADAINTKFGSDIAAALDAVSVAVSVPDSFKDSQHIVTFIADLENVNFEPDYPARVVINERTGTIVIGQAVNIATVAVSHGALSITIKSTPMVSQPQPFSRGETVSEQYQEVTVEQHGTGVVVINGTSTVGDVATALNRLGVTPRDIIAIFQALSQSGALQAELVII
ncbi:MAG: flagellar basal body P-ring protein FlgI, partial [Calditrichota bacterium]